MHPSWLHVGHTGTGKIRHSSGGIGRYNYRNVSRLMEGSKPMKDFTAEDRAHREALEKMSPSGARVNMAATLNAIAKVHGAREMPGLTALDVLRKSQEISRRTPAAHNRAHDLFEKAGGLEGFNRLHPEIARQSTGNSGAGRRGLARRRGSRSVAQRRNLGNRCRMAIGGGEGVDRGGAGAGAAVTGEDFEDVASYIVKLENTILIAARALREGDAGHAKRVLFLAKEKILAGPAEMEAGQDATRH